MGQSTIPRPHQVRKLHDPKNLQEVGGGEKELVTRARGVRPFLGALRRATNSQHKPLPP